MTRIFSYIVRYDVGFAPNPFLGWCTLATCKQEIRVKAAVGDWLVGTGSREHNREGRLVYAMRVDEVLSFDDYWKDPRFNHKKPNFRGSLKQAYGDNIYHHTDDGSWVQENSRHSFGDGSMNPGHVNRDTRADAVLVGREFVYFGGNGPQVPEQLRSGYGKDLVHARPSHRCRFPDDMVEAVIAWIRELGTGLQSDPGDW